MKRPNKIELDHREANLSFDARSTSRHSYTSADHQTLHMIVADGRTDDQHDTGQGETIIWPASFGSRADRLEEARASVLAARTGARVAYVETPGVSINIDEPAQTNAGKLTRQQITSLLHGKFDPMASVQLDALDEVLQFHDKQEVRFVGYSMGSWATATMAKLLARNYFPDKQIVIPRIDLIEPVNDQNYRLNDLRHRINQEEQFGERYFIDENAENQLYDEYAMPIVPFDRTSADSKKIVSRLNRRQNIALKTLSLGLRRGFAASLTQAVTESSDSTYLNDGEINIWRANESLVARPEANLHTTDQLGRIGRLAVRMTEMYPTPRDMAKGHHHAIVHSVGNVANLAQQHLRHESRVAY